MKRLTWDEMQKRRVKGLCFNCDEKFVPRHKCKRSQLLLLEGNYEESETDDEEGAHANFRGEPKISLHAFTRWSIARTMRVSTKVRPHELIVLIDSGSTHNFINVKIAELLQLSVVPTEPFNVKVANGDPLKCQRRFESVRVLLQGAGIGTVLTQQGKPIAFMSRALGITKQSWSTYAKEMLAIVQAIRTWHPYLLGRKFYIQTNHRSLKYLMEQCIVMPEQQKWVSNLLGYDYEITYKSKRENSAADALSRVIGSPSLNTLFVPQTSLWNAIMIEAKEHPYMQLKINLHAAVNRMKQVADSKRRHVEFQVGDLVFLKLHPYQQQTVYMRAYQKLASRFYGPYQIEAKVGKVAYKLKLSEGSRIHLVFHVSMLKKKVGETNATSTDLPPIADDGDVIMEPEAILDTRWVRKGSSFIEESLVQWKRLPKEYATWENTQELRNRFINLNLEDKVPLKEGDNDKPRRSTRVPIKNPRYGD
ncbi:hypothetical protein F0562_003295 [Nyssa sinensis]|uniref:Chromo domain-containing protein n=1 Tax=Nyssa sinensis TaxID=561372 RepID=A0A5J5BW05_9ASTE|nr:hypothetical protein F0562_003295 [Nyssa sinensis]